MHAPGGWIWRSLLAALLCLIPVAETSAGGDGEIDLVVQIYPGPWGGTVSAGIAYTAPALTGDERVAAFELVVCDDRGTAAGWQVQIAQVVPATGVPFRMVSLRHRLSPARVLAGQPVTPPLGPRAYRRVDGQPLTQAVPIIVAMPGAGAGIYAFTGAVDRGTQRSLGDETLILVLASAP